MPIVSVERAAKWIPAFAGMTKWRVSRLFRFAALLLILALAALPARADDLAKQSKSPDAANVDKFFAQVYVGRHGSDQGAQVTLNGGATWSSWYNQPTGQFYHASTDNRFPYWVYGAQQDSGAAGVPSRTSSIDGIAMPQFREITAGGESDNIAPDPDNPEIYGGRVERLDLRDDQTRNIDPTLAFRRSCEDDQLLMNSLTSSMSSASVISRSSR